MESAMPRVSPAPIVIKDIHDAKNPLRSVRVPSDLVPYRRRADVYFTGSAHAVSGPVESTGVRFGVATSERVLFDKVLLVRKKGGVSRVSLVWEHAVGGPGHPENPLGEEEGSDDLCIFDRAQPSRPAGFGPLGPAMPARARVLGPLPLPALGATPVSIPDDFDFDFFQAAPPDQQIGFLRGDEWILLERLHPQHPTLRMCLPGARAQARIHGLADHGIPEGRPLAMSADVLHVDGDEERCTVAWRGTFAIGSEAALPHVRLAAGVETPGEPIAWPDAAELARAIAEQAAAARPALEISAIHTMALDDTERTLPVSSTAFKGPRAALPFRALSLGERAAAQAPARTAALPRAHRGAGETLPIASDAAPPMGTLPFDRPHAARASEPAPAPDPEPPAPKAAVLEQTLDSIAPAPPAPKVVLTREPDPPAAPPPAPRPAPEKRMPPKVDVANKLYRNRKKT
jgi:hypothetical protein